MRQRLMELFEQIGNAMWAASARNDLGLLAIELGSFDSAENHLTSALDFEKHHGDTTRTVRVINALGRLYQRQGQTWRALGTYAEALEQLEESESVEDILVLLINTATIYLELEQFDKAWKTLERAEPHLRAGKGMAYYRGLIDLNAGAAAYGLERYRIALYRLEKSAAVWTRLGRAIHLGRTWINMGDANRRMSRYDNAVMLYQQAVETLEPMRHIPLAGSFLQEVQEKQYEMKVSSAAFANG